MNRLQELLDIMAMLRDPEKGCPWDLQQDFRSIAPHTLEESYEVVDAIENGDHAQLRNELGDLLFQVVFYAQLGKERGLFDFEDVAGEICEKLLHRHPHVFPEGTAESFGAEPSLTPAQVESNWETLKLRERELKKSPGRRGEHEEESLLDDVPLAFPALTRAGKLQKRAAAVGFDWPDARGVLDKLKEEIGELEEALAGGQREAAGEELGDVLFTVVNLSRHLKLEAETSLRHANGKFERRFRRMETFAKRDERALRELDPAEREEYWRAVKDEETPRS